MAHHKTEKKGMESKAGKLKIHGGFKAAEYEKMGGKHEHEGKKERKK